MKVEYTHIPRSGAALRNGAVWDCPHWIVRVDGVAVAEGRTKLDAAEDYGMVRLARWLHAHGHPTEGITSRIGSHWREGRR